MQANHTRVATAPCPQLRMRLLQTNAHKMQKAVKNLETAVQSIHGSHSPVNIKFRLFWVLLTEAFQNGLPVKLKSKVFGVLNYSSGLETLIQLNFKQLKIN